MIAKGNVKVNLTALVLDQGVDLKKVFWNTCAQRSYAGF
jgi:hypothetical protein